MGQADYGRSGRIHANLHSLLSAGEEKMTTKGRSILIMLMVLGALQGVQRVSGDEGRAFSPAVQKGARSRSIRQDLKPVRTPMEEAELKERDLVTRIRNLESERNMLEDKIENLKMSREQFESRIENLETSLTCLQSEKRDLEYRVRELEMKTQQHWT